MPCSGRPFTKLSDNDKDTKFYLDSNSEYFRVCGTPRGLFVVVFFGFFFCRK